MYPLNPILKFNLFEYFIEVSYHVFRIRVCFHFAFISFIINENFHIQVGTQNPQCNLFFFFFEPFVLNQELSQLRKKNKKNEEYREEYFNLTLVIN